MFSLPLNGLYHFIPWIKGCPLVPGWNLWPCCGSASQRPRDWTRGRYLSLGASKYWSKGWCTTFDGFWWQGILWGYVLHFETMPSYSHTWFWKLQHTFLMFGFCLSGKHIPRSKSDALGSWCKDCRRSKRVKMWIWGLFRGCLENA